MATIGKLNPYDLTKWEPAKDRPTHFGPVEYAFSQTFSVAEKFNANADGLEMGKDANFDARQSLYAIAKMVDSKNITRAMIQLGDDEAMIVDLVPCDNIEYKAHPDSGDPLVMVRVAYHTRNSNIDTVMIAQDVARSMPENGCLQVKCCSKEEMEVLSSFFQKNAAKLEPKFITKFDANLPNKLKIVPGIYTSFLSPLYIKKPPKAPQETCLSCGEPAKRVCSRCKVARYCNKDCQVKHWKDSHKKECKSPEEDAGASNESNNEESSELWVDIDPQKTPESMRHTSSISSRHMSIGQMMKKTKITDTWTIFDNIHKDRMMILKVQVRPGSDPSEGEPILIYPQTKKFQIFCIPKNTINGFEGYRKLDAVVRTHGTDAGLGMGGCKVYINGYVTKDGNLRIMLNQVKPLQKW